MSSPYYIVDIARIKTRAAQLKKPYVLNHMLLTPLHFNTTGKRKTLIYFIISKLLLVNNKLIHIVIISAL